MAISKETETRGKTRPILLKGTGQSMCLEVKIGNLGVELWDFPDGEALPHARLLFEPAQVGNLGAIDELAEGGDYLHVDLNVMQTGALSVAIEQWLLSFESETKEESVPSLHMQITSLSMDFYPKINEQAAKAEISVRTKDGLKGQAVLTRLEASLLGTLLESLVEEEKTDSSGYAG